MVLSPNGNTDSIRLLVRFARKRSRVEMLVELCSINLELAPG